MPIYTILHVHGLLRSLDQSQEGCLLHHIQQARIDYFTQKYCFNCGYGKRIKKAPNISRYEQKKPLYYTRENETEMQIWKTFLIACIKPG